MDTFTFDHRDPSFKANLVALTAHGNGYGITTFVTLVLMDACADLVHGTKLSFWEWNTGDHIQLYVPGQGEVFFDLETIECVRVRISRR